MYVILFYDVSCKRISKVMKVCREYLHHIQNSVFEGELEDHKVAELEHRLETIVQEEDSILMFCFKFIAKGSLERKVIGVEKYEISNVL